MAGAIVAGDLTLQRLLWQFQYRDLMQVDAPHRGPALAELSSRYNLDDEHVDHWQETSVTITGGQIVFGARDSSEVFCLDLASGRPNWSLPRDQALSVATADSERVVLLGRNQLQAYRLDNAEPIWESPIPIPEPGGQGLRNGDRYRLPLSTGDFVTVNLVSGRIEARSPLESAAAAGNLVTGKGVLVAQSATQLTAFTPLDQRANEIEAHLAQTPDDPHWLALRGELRLHSGQRAEGLIDLRKSLQQRVDPRIRRLIVSTLLEAMRLDFDGQDTATAEIEKLVTEPAQRAVFLRLYAEGLHRAGRVMEAYDRYVEMADLASEQSKLERIDSKLSVRMDCWVRSRLTDLYQTASPADQKTLRDRISHRIAEAAEQPGTASLQSLLNSLGGPPFGSEIRQQIVAKMEPTTTPLELELELLALRESSGQTTRGEATARLTLLYLQQNMPELAFWLLDELEFDFPDVVCLDGKTGRDLVDLWKDRPELAGKDESISPWPTGEIQARRIRRSGSLDRLYPIEIRGRYGTPTFDWQLQIDQSREFLYARDASQRLLWKFALKETGVPVPYIDGHAAYSCGHLLVVSMGNQFVVLDTMSTPGEPKLLWKLSYYEITADPLITGIQLRPVIGPGGKRRSVVTDVSGQPLGEVAAVTSNCLYYQVGTHLYAADVLTGKILWERRGVQPGLEIFGDDQYLFVVSPEGEHVRLIRSSDGEDLGTRPIPPAYYRLHTSGRRTVLLNRDRAIPLLASVDLVTSGVVWKEEFQEPALGSIIGDDEIGYYVRWAAASTYLFMVRDGRLTRDEAVQRLYWNLRESVQQGIIENAGFLVAELSDFAHPAVLPGVREAFRLDLVDPFLIDEHDAVSIIQQGDSSFQEQLRACKSTGIEDTVEELRHWASFAEDEKDEALEDDDYDVEEIAAGIHQFLDQLVADRQFDSRANSTADDEDYPEPTAPIRREQQRVSRNQPCPCGSGKKYKRCCGSSG